MEDFLVGIIRFVGSLWDADERPEARRLTIGCGGILAVLGLVVWWLLR